MEDEFRAHGLELIAEDRSKAGTAVKKAFLKDDSFGRVLTLNAVRKPSDVQTLRIKLEIDVNPPSHSEYSTHVVNYPFPFSIVAQNLPSLFAGKCVALFCRPYEKGRDWYDFLWYLRAKTPINYSHLHAGLMQYQQKNKLPFTVPKKIDREWLIDALCEKNLPSRLEPCQDRYPTIFAS